MYGCYYSPQTISNMTQVVAEEVDAFHNRPLPSQFAVVYLDATFITVKRGTAQKEALHVLIGITPSGEKHVIDYGIYPNESTLAYKELLDHAKQRGLEDILLLSVMDFKDYNKLVRKYIQEHVSNVVGYILPIQHN